VRRTRAAVPLIALVAPLGVVLGPGAAAMAAEACDGRVPTIVAAAGVATSGTPGDDVILGTNGKDTIDGRGGNDTICGLIGRDTLVGGPGNDRLFGGLDDPGQNEEAYLADLLVPGPGDDYVDLGDDPAAPDAYNSDALGQYDRVSYRDAPGPVRVNLSTGTASGEGSDTIVVPQYSGGIVGSAHDDVLVGTDGPDRIQGGGGDDRIQGRDGNDEIQPDTVGPTTLDDYSSATAPGNDAVRAGAGEDIVISVTGRDRVYGGGGPDEIVAKGRGSEIGGGGERDYLWGGVDVDVHGGGDIDSITSFVAASRQELDGGSGDDVLKLTAVRKAFGQRTSWYVDVPGEQLRADGRTLVVYQGVESLRFSAPGARLTYAGGPRGDYFYTGSPMHVTAYGRGGNDILSGSRLTDLLDGGPGRDELYGGEARDRCLNGEQLSQCEVRR